MLKTTVMSLSLWTTTRRRAQEGNVEQEQKRGIRKKTTNKNLSPTSKYAREISKNQNLIFLKIKQRKEINFSPTSFNHSFHGIKTYKASTTNENKLEKINM